MLLIVLVVVLFNSAKINFINAQEKNEIMHGMCGEKVEWTLYNDGCLIITGSGMMTNYSFWRDSIPWSDYTDTITKVKIEGNVENVGDYAFSDCMNITDISITDSVITIGNSAFQYAKIEQIKLPSGLKEIGDSAFSECTKLKSLDIPNTVTIIGSYAFSGCKNLISVKLSNNMKKIATRTFMDCTNLKNIAIPASIKYIEEESFTFYFGADKTRYIFYGGTKKQWDSIEYKYNYNKSDLMDHAKIHYSAMDHVWNSEYTIDKEATCIESGSKSIYCSICGLKKENSDVEIPAGENHIIEIKNAKEADCISEGYTGDKVCTVCGKTIETGTILPSLNRIEATGKFALLKIFIQRNGKLDAEGNRFIENTVALDKGIVKSTIYYLDNKAKFKFQMEFNGGLTEMLLDENGSEITTVKCSEKMLNLEAEATLDIKNYSKDTRLYFKKTSSSFLDDSKIQDLFNSEMKLSMSSWDTLFLMYLGFDINMADMGFNSYESVGTHTWDEGVITKKPTVDREGEKTYTCLVCNKKKVEIIHKLNAVKKQKQRVRFVSSKTIKAKFIKKKSRVLRIHAKSTSGNRVKYKILKKNKNIKFSPFSGKLTIKKGTKKGKYKIKIKMSVAENDKYQSYSAIKIITIRIK